MTDLELKTTTKRKRATTLVVDLRDLKTPWSDWCVSQHLTPSEAVRQVLRAVVTGKPKSDLALHVDSAKSGDSADRKRCEIRMSGHEHKALVEAADREGMSLPRWFQALIRTYLTGRQQFGSHEIEALNKSTQALLAIGRNVNQIARSMNERPEKDELTLAQIDFVAREIREHTQAVRALLDANSKRWRP